MTKDQDARSYLAEKVRSWAGVECPARFSEPGKPAQSADCGESPLCVCRQTLFKLREAFAQHIYDLKEEDEAYER